MENELIIQQFEKIEQKIERLIAERRELEATNQELQQKVAAIEEELQQKGQAENKIAQERALIRSKIDGLLVKLNDMASEET